MAVSLASRQHVDIVRTANLMESDQAYLYALGLETVAVELLQDYALENSYDDPEVLFQPYTFPVEGGVVSGTLQDMEAKYNLNNLLIADPETENGYKINPLEKSRLHRLISRVMMQLGENVDADELINAIADWIDPDMELSFGGGAEDSEYSSLEQPYRAANRLMVSVTELSTVMGFSREMLYGKQVDGEHVPGLLKYVTVLPDSSTTINVNTAPAELLMSISDQFDESVVAELISTRNQSPYEKIGDFTGHETITQILATMDGDDNKDEKDAFMKEYGFGLDVKSQFFMVNGSAQIGRSTTMLNSLVFREAGGRNVLAVSRAIGTDGI
jgi:general secretion pathway protein K